MSDMKKIGNALVNLDLVEAIVPDKFKPTQHVIFSRGHIIAAEISAEDLEAAFCVDTRREATVPDGLYALTSDEYAELQDLAVGGFSRIYKRPGDPLAMVTGVSTDGADMTAMTRNPFIGLEREDGKPFYIPELLTLYEAKL